MVGISRLAKTWSPQVCKVPRLRSTPRDERSSGMEVEEKADEPVASVKALSEFHFYPLLPAEMKLEIWVEVFKHWSSGVHCFTLTIDPDDRTRLTIQPSGYREDDSSAWRERYALARIDKYSFDGLLRFERRATTLYHDTLRRHTVRVEENGLSAVVDGKTDLITFRYQYGATRASLSFLDFSAHWDIFANITRIGVDYGYFIFGPRKHCKQKPFACMCPNINHSEVNCKRSWIRFIQAFKNLEVFYLIVPLIRRQIRPDLDPVKSLPLELPRLRPSGHGVTQDGLDVFRRLQEIAQQRGLRQFQDRSRMYCEVLAEDGSDLLRRHPWSSLQELASYNNGREVKFEVLVCADLRGVTVSGDERPLRRPGPWY
ncbi:hypothetical protein F5X98DRAFT_95919 [Xylaria grammica]|nr:hypothetical protein F5X98DRAFT_95919 [Xylaria grammica]